MRNVLFGLIVAISFSGCSTKYQEMSASGGVSAQPLTSNVFRIVARGNGYTNHATIQDFVLLKAAETTLQTGGSHFVILGVEDTTSRSWVTLPTQVRTSNSGSVNSNTLGTFNRNTWQANTRSTWQSNTHSTISPGSVHQVIRPGQYLLIRVHRKNEERRLPRSAIDAQDLYNNIAPRVCQKK